MLRAVPSVPAGTRCPSCCSGSPCLRGKKGIALTQPHPMGCCPQPCWPPLVARRGPCPSQLTMCVVLLPLRHPEAAQPHVPEDEGALWKAGGEICLPPTCSQAHMSMAGGSEELCSELSFGTNPIRQVHVNARPCTTALSSSEGLRLVGITPGFTSGQSSDVARMCEIGLHQGMFNAQHLWGCFHAGIPKQPKPSISTTIPECKPARPITAPNS